MEVSKENETETEVNRADNKVARDMGCFPFYLFFKVFIPITFIEFNHFKNTMESIVSSPEMLRK